MSRLSDASIEARVAVMSVADLRATIVAAGRSHEDVVEKGELRRRAMAALAATNDHRDAEDGAPAFACLVTRRAPDAGARLVRAGQGRRPEASTESAQE